MQEALASRDELPTCAAGRVAIVGAPANTTNRAVTVAWRALGIDADTLWPWEAAATLRRGDVAIGRIDVRVTLDGLEPGVLELAALARRGVRVLNTPRALLATHDKLRTARLLAQAGLPAPDTYHVRPGRPLPPLEPPFVVKPRFGSWGRDVFRCDSRSAVRRTLGLLGQRDWYRRQGAVAQPLVPPVGHDLRLLVAGNRVVGAIRRVAKRGEWRTNFSLGGTLEPAVPPPAACALGIAAAAAVGADLVGVDLLPCRGGYQIVELNGAIDFEREYSLPGRDVYADAAASLRLGSLELAAAG